MATRLACLAVLLGARWLGAQEDEGARLYPLLEIGVARALATTLADRSATGATSSGAYHESVRLRLDGQWGIVAEGRVPVGASKVWAVELYGARFRGPARLSAARQAPTSAALPTVTQDTVDYRISGVTSWRGTLGVVRAVPLAGPLTGALLLGATYGTVQSTAQPCTSASCPPVLRLTTPGATIGAEVFTREWRGLRLRVALKDDLLRVDDAEVRRSARWSAFSAAPLGEGGSELRAIPSLTAGVEFRIRP